MTVKKLRLFIKLQEELYILSSKIFRYAKEKYEGQLAFGRYSSYCDFLLDENGLGIKYDDFGRDYSDCVFLPAIPLDCVADESLWKQFLDDYFERKIAKQKRKTEEEEYQYYLRLKEKYETV